MDSSTENLAWKPELLAPAGRADVLEAVLAAGADAAYISGKQFNMRRHRKDFHFDDDALAAAVREAHSLGKKLYVTVNILVGGEELSVLRDYLVMLSEIGVDALIVQDLATVQLCRKLDLKPELHASTMMNVSSTAGAAFLRDLGFTRAVTSRDITLADARRIAEQAGIEVEYFVHGDMCSVLSGRCLTSGLIFGKSSNRGQCMKPCRWAYDLVSESTGRVIKEGAYLLAARDMCLLQHVPELIRHRIDSLKIEGRMRPAETLRPIVEAYRAAIDRAVSEPLAPARTLGEAAYIHRSRTRNLTTGFAFRCPDVSFMDLSGEREPIIFSTHGTMKSCENVEIALELRETNPSQTEMLQGQPELTAVVGNTEGANAALAAGADRLIFSWEGDLSPESGWILSDIEGICRTCREQKASVLLSTPRIVDDVASIELERLLDHPPSVDGYVIADTAALKILPKGIGELWADASLNVMNAEAAQLLREHGVSCIMPALEASLKTIGDMMAGAPELRYDLLAHGPLTGMLIEHCLLGMNMQHGSKMDFCQMPCSMDRFVLVDKKGNRRRILTDRYCRNHIILERDLATFPVLDSLLSLRPASVRIDCRLYSPDVITDLVGFYMNRLRSERSDPEQGRAFEAVYPLALHTFGAYPSGICGDERISRLDLKREEQRER